MYTAGCFRCELFRIHQLGKSRSIRFWKESSKKFQIFMPSSLPLSLAVAMKKSLDVHFSSATEEWATPQWLFDALNKEFGFTLDVCSTHDNAKCKRHFTREDDGLAQSWENQVCWMNPPYGTVIKKWMARAHHQATVAGATVVCLVPARTDTSWWHDYVMKHEIRLLRGRLKFGEAVHSAPFPSAIIVMRPRAFTLTALNL